MTPPLSMPDNPINAVTTKFVRTSTNKMRCPIFCVAVSFCFLVEISTDYLENFIAIIL